MRSVDVLVVGAGPAGASVALNLAPVRRVLVVDPSTRPAQRYGETLPPAARRLLGDMGLFTAFEAERHTPCHANSSIWGASHVVDTHLLHDLDGYGWLLDRERFVLWLRAVALFRGANLIAPAKVRRLDRRARGWRATIASRDSERVIDAGVVVDATGRRAAVARRVGAKRTALDRLVCRWTLLEHAGHDAAGMTFVQATADGWWYSAPACGARRLLAYHTDADLPPARLRGPAELRAAARRDGAIGDLVASGTDSGIGGLTAAHSSVLDLPAANDLVAVGDAAAAFDPLCARGIYTALFTGLAAAEAIDRHLSGDRAALVGYAAVATGLQASYWRERAYWYAAETRWPEAPFWSRRAPEGTALDQG